MEQILPEKFLLIHPFAINEIGHEYIDPHNQQYQEHYIFKNKTNADKIACGSAIATPMNRMN
jgi:hypothetical protein